MLLAKVIVDSFLSLAKRFVGCGVQEFSIEGQSMVCDVG